MATRFTIALVLILALSARASAQWPLAVLDGAEIAEIPLPDGLPIAFRVPVRFAGRERTLFLERRSLRRDDFRLLIQRAGGRLEEVPAPAPRTYLGSIEGESGSSVAASLTPAGLCALVLPLRGEAFCVRPRSEFEGVARSGEHLVFADSALARSQPDSGGVEVPSELLGEPSAAAIEGEGGAVCKIKVADLAYDSDYEFYDRKSNRDEALAMSIIEEGLNLTNLLYIRDVKITHRLATVVLRTDPATDPYAKYPDGSDFGGLLTTLRTHWNANMGAVDRDMAYLLTGKPNPALGGLAFVGVVCSDFAYGVGIGGPGYWGIMRHELGHNWNCGHDCGNESGYIMCGNSIDAFAGYHVKVVTAYRDSRTCLDEIDLESPPEAPYVRPDPVSVVQGQGPLAVDILANDTDRNCDGLDATRFDSLSAFGGVVRLSDASEFLGAGGPPGLLYSSRTLLPGMDSIGYTVSDGTGFEIPTLVPVEVQPRALIAYWRLDETAGESAADSSGFGRDGSLEGGLSFAGGGAVLGKSGGALKFTGEDGKRVEVSHRPSFGLERALTVATWFKIDAFSGDGESLVAKGGDAWRLKRDGTTNALKFTCTGLAGTEVKGRTNANDGQWHHAAGVYDGARLLLYVDGRLDASRPAAGAIHTNGSDVRLGDDLFNGLLDEVRIYNFALSIEEITALVGGARPENPNPIDGSGHVNPGAALSWVSAPGATQHEIYLGTDRAAVETATPGSPAHRGRRSGATYTPVLDPATVYFWRVDGIRGGEILRGPVWSFTTSFAYSNFSEPALNASSYVPKAGAKEIGFQTTFTPTGGQDPLAAVVTTGSTPTSPVFSHRSVEATTTFDFVDLAGRGPSGVALILQARGTGYEAGDLLDILVTNGVETRALVRMEGPSGLNQVEGRGYATYAAAIPEGWTRARLVIATSSDSSQGSERFDFDSVSFSCRSAAQVIASSAFLEPTLGAKTYAPGAAANEIGFQTTSTANGANSLVGVRAGPRESVRVLTHRSANATTTFESVDLAGRTGLQASIVLRVADTGYEASDFLRVTLADGAQKITLMDFTGDTGLDALSGQGYLAYTAVIPGEWKRVAITVASSSNSSTGAEAFDVHVVEFVSWPAGAPCEVTEPPPPPGTQFQRGDVNADGELDLTDGVGILNYLFLGAAVPACLDAADADDSAELDLTDAVGIFGYLFLGGGPPAAPAFPMCGLDESEDSLDCGAFPGCE